MANSFFVGGDGFISTEETTVSLDLVNFRDNFFQEGEYLYNIHRWRRITVSYLCQSPKISNQKFEIHFDMTNWETSSSTTTVKLSEAFIGSPILDAVTVYDHDNGSVHLKPAQVLAVDSSFQFPSELPTRPTAVVLDSPDATTAIVSLEDASKFKVGWRLTAKDGEFISPTVLTIQSIDEETGAIVFDQAPFPVHESFLTLSAPNGYKYEITVTDEGELSSTLNLSAKRSPLFKVPHAKADPEDADAYSCLRVGNDGTLAIEMVDSSLWDQYETRTAFYLKSPDNSAWNFKFDEFGMLQTEKKDLPLVGTELIFAPDQFLKEDQLIDYRSN